MAVHNADIASLFNRLADLLEIEGANAFRIRAHRRAAQTIEDLPVGAAEMIAKGEDLAELPGIGADLSAKVHEIVATGRLKLLEEVEARTPSTLAALTTLPGLGPKRVHALHEKLGITTLDQLARAAAAQKVRTLPGFSERMEARIIEEIAKHRTSEQRWKISTAADFATISAHDGTLCSLEMAPFRIHKFRLQAAARHELEWLAAALTREGAPCVTHVTLSPDDTLRLN